jgi:hypothetical protein
MIDLRRQIEAHPWELVTAAALLGAWIGFEPPRVRGAVRTLVLRLVRDAAFRELGVIAMRWLSETTSKVGSNGEPDARGQNGHGERART